MNDTKYTETNALILALEDNAADSGNHDPLDTYLRENFTRHELSILEGSAYLLADRAGEARRQSPKTGTR